MIPQRSKWSCHPDAEYLSLDEDRAFVLKGDGGGSLCLSSTPHAWLSFGILCRWVFEVCPFVLEDSTQLVLTTVWGGGRW